MHTLDLCRLLAVAAFAAVAPVSSAFRPGLTAAKHLLQTSHRQLATMMANYYPHPPFVESCLTHCHLPFCPRHSPRYLPRYSVALDAEVIADADKLLDDLREEDDWTTDRQREKIRREKDEVAGSKRGEAIIVDPDHPSSAPLNSAAAYASDLYDDESKFEGRKAGQPVNRRGREAGRREDMDAFIGRAIGKDVNANDPREQHVILDNYDIYMDDFFQPPPPPPRSPQRPGPSVYTQEEEDLIASMGGKHRPTTHKSVGLGTMAKKDRRAQSRYDSRMPTDPQQVNYNPEQAYAPPSSPPSPSDFRVDPMFAERAHLREDGYLGDSTLKEISHDYSVPVPYLADVLATWGTPVPIDPLSRLGDMVTGEQAFAVLEAIHTLDVAELHERYSDENLMSICDFYGIDLKEAFKFCIARGWALPFGVRTFLRVEQEEELLGALGDDDY